MTEVLHITWRRALIIDYHGETSLCFVGNHLYVFCSTSMYFAVSLCTPSNNMFRSYNVVILLKLSDGFRGTTKNVEKNYRRVQDTVYCFYLSQCSGGSRT